jgi:hypothetical protein
MLAMMNFLKYILHSYLFASNLGIARSNFDQLRPLSLRSQPVLMFTPCCWIRVSSNKGNGYSKRPRQRPNATPIAAKQVQIFIRMPSASTFGEAGPAEAARPVAASEVLIDTTLVVLGVCEVVTIG